MSHALWGHLRQKGHSGEFWGNVMHWKGEWQTTPVYLLWEPHKLYKKAKTYDTKMSPPIWKVSNMLLGKSREQLLIAPERMKWLGQSRNDIQLWVCLEIKVKSDPVKNSIAQDPGMLGPWIKVNWTWSGGRWQELYQHLRNQWTKMNRNGQI